MPKSHPTRSAVVAAVRALLRDPSKACGPRDPVLPITLTERCRGGEMARWDARIDLALTLGALDVLADAGLPRTLASARNAAANDPSAATVKKVRLLLFRAVDTDKLGDADCKACIDLATSLIFHEAAFGCSIAGGCASSMCLAQSVRDLREDRPGEAWLAMRAAMRYAENAREDLTRYPYIPEPLFADFGSYDLMVDRIGIMAALVVSAEHAEAVSYDDVLRGGAGASAPEWAEDTDLSRIRLPEPAPSILVLPAAADGKKPKGQAGTIAGRRLPCVPMPDLQDLGRRLVERTPWAEAAIARIVGMMLGRPYAAAPNILLVGPPGGGKTSLARDLVAAMGVPSIVYACASASDSSFGGTAAQWSTSRPSVMAQLPITSGSGNGVVILDEIEKSPATGGHNGSLREVLLGLAEPSTRRQYWDIGLETTVDLSGISLVATANDTLSLRGPLLDRFVVVEVGTPRRRDLPVLVRGILDDLRADVADARWIPDLDGVEIDALAGAWRGGSIRPLRRAVERIVALRSSPRLAH